MPIPDSSDLRAAIARVCEGADIRIICDAAEELIAVRATLVDIAEYLLRFPGLLPERDELIQRIRNHGVH